MAIIETITASCASCEDLPDSCPLGSECGISQAYHRLPARDKLTLAWELATEQTDSYGFAEILVWELEYFGKLDVESPDIESAWIEAQHMFDEKIGAPR